MKTKIRKYKGYMIDAWYKQDTDRVDYYRAIPMRHNEAQEIRKEIIEKVWHGADCECVECTYTQADRLHNEEVNRRAKLIINEIKLATFQRLTLKECKQEIDKREL
mgnify:CR=1 FL=1|tara:strand:+ start:170 stop:487 length:318 start_codon:yes stop_codon:yes gene_type:complete